MHKIFFIVLVSLFSISGFSENKTTYISPSDLQKNTTSEVVQNTTNIDTNFDEQPPITTLDYKPPILKMILALIFVILLGSVTLWSFKRLAKSRLYTANLNNQIKVLEKRILSPKSILYLIEFDGKKMIVSESHLDMKIKILE